MFPFAQSVNAKLCTSVWIEVSGAGRVDMIAATRLRNEIVRYIVEITFPIYAVEVSQHPKT
jgi:hypothetical protein